MNNHLSAENIYDLIEKNLDQTEKKEIENHLYKCEVCLKYFEDRKGLIHSLNSIERMGIPEEFSEKILKIVFPAKVKLKNIIFVLSSGTFLFYLTLFIVSILNYKREISTFPKFLFFFIDSIKNTLSSFSRVISNLYFISKFVLEVIFIPFKFFRVSVFSLGADHISILFLITILNIIMILMLYLVLKKFFLRGAQSEKTSLF
ncbi:MAG: hypothetical protein AB1410_04930 [Acidobacteriota bacterium]